MATKAEILAAFRKASVKTIQVEGLDVTIRGLTGGDRVAFNLAIEEAKKAGQVVPDYLVAFYGWCDSEGVRLFERPEELADIDGNVLQVIALEVLRASGLYAGGDGEASSAEVAQGN